MKKLLRAIVIALFICNVFVSTIYAEPKIKEYYSIDLDSLNINVKQYLTSLSIDKDTRAVFMNNVYVGTQTSDPQTFVLSTENYSISANVSVSNLSCTAKVNVATEKHYTAVFDIQIAENTYYVCNFYPDYKSNPSYCVTNKATRNGDIQDFGTFTYTYGNESMSFSVLMTQSDGSVYVNGKNIGSLGKSNIPIVFEYIGSDFPITNIDYQKQLPMFDWPTASSTTKVFYGRNFGDISFKEKYDLSNEYLNLPSVEIAFGSTVKEWHRVSGTSTTGTGEWQPTGREIAVVCEYNENYDISKDCVNAIRNEFPRYWAVWASSQDFGSSVSKLSKTYPELVDGYVNYYNTGNWTYLDGAFDGPASGDGITKQQRSQTKSWSSWSEWTTNYISPAFGVGTTMPNKKGEQAEFYRYRTWAYSDATGWMTSSSTCAYMGSDTKTISTTRQDEACGTTARSCRTSGNGCETYASCQYIACGYNYKTCRTEACGTESYKSSDTGCQRHVDKTCSKEVKTPYTCKTGNSCQCPNKTCVNTTCAKRGSCPSSVPTSACCAQWNQSCSYTYSCACYGTCYSTSTEYYDCSYYDYGGPCWGTRYKSCTHQDCGNESLKSCRNANCGCETYKYGQNSECGVDINTCTMYKCQVKQYSNWTDYTSKDHCPYLPSDVNMECDTNTQTKYRYSDLVLGDWGSWYNVSNYTAGTANMNFQYRYSTPTIKVEKEKATGYEGSSSGWWSGKKESMGLQDVEHDIANVGGRQYWSNYPYYTEELVNEFQDKFATSKAGKVVHDSLLGKSDKPYVLWNDFENALSSSSAYNEYLNYIKNQSIYQPYLYFYAWRFITSNMDVPVGNSSKSVIGEQIISYSSNGNLIESSEQVGRDTKVIYFDYKDPLTHYKDELPENWQGYEYLVEQIKNSDLDTSKIKVRLSADDIIAMKEYLENGGYDNVSDCEMIRQFSYIFITTDLELQEWLDSGSSCKIGD